MILRLLSRKPRCLHSYAFHSFASEYLRMSLRPFARLSPRNHSGNFLTSVTSISNASTPSGVRSTGYGLRAAQQNFANERCRAGGPPRGKADALPLI